MKRILFLFFQLLLISSCVRAQKGFHNLPIKLYSIYSETAIGIPDLQSSEFSHGIDSLQEGYFVYLKVEILGEINQDSLILELGRATYRPKVITRTGVNTYRYGVSSYKDKFYSTPFDIDGVYRISKDELFDNQEFFILHELPKRDYKFSRIGNVKIYEEGVEFSGYMEAEWRSNFNVSIVFIGFSFFIIVFGLSMYFLSKEREYAYYILSAITSILYLTGYDIGLDQFLFRQAPWLYLQALIAYQFLIYIFYNLFAYHFLEMKYQYPRLATIMRMTVLTLIILLIAYFVFSYINKRDSLYNNIPGLIVDLHRLVLVLVGAYSMYYLIRYAKSKLPYFIVIGSIFFTIGSLMYLFFEDKNFQIYGTVVEMIIFSVGLAYKYHITTNKVQELNLKTVNLKLEALLSQLNPHFIFNSLNTIHSLVSLDKKPEAMKYTLGFSNFLRRSLDLSKQQNSSLASDIELVGYYLNLERLRYSEGFSFEIKVDPLLDLENEMVPCLLTQPFLENSIKHGISSTRVKNKKVIVSYKSFSDNIVLCEIEDNGLGISHERMTEITNGRLTRNYGIGLAMDRLKYFDQKGISKIEFYNKTVESDGESGLRVSVYIPKIN